MPIVDVIITTYKREQKMVLRAVNSVLSQSTDDISLVIVDDNGDRGLLSSNIQDAIKKLDDPRITYLQNDANVGACVSRNRGIQHGSAPYVAFLDDDDEWLPDKLKIQLEEIEKNASQLVFCAFDDMNDITGKISHHHIAKDKVTYHDLIEYGNIIGSTSCVLVRRDALVDSGLFDPSMQSSQDFDLWIRILKKGIAIGIDKQLLIYHLHAGERISMNPEKKYMGTLRIYNKNAADINASHVASARIFRLLSRYSYAMGRKKKAFIYFAKAVKAQPISLNNLKLIIILLTNYWAGM